MVNQSPSQGTLVLVIDGEIQPDAVYPLSSSEEIVIGRDSSCDISLDFDANISRLHATIEPLKPDGWQIVDHNAANGTYIALLILVRYRDCHFEAGGRKKCTSLF